MDVVDTVNLIRRRKVVVIPVLVITAVAAIYMLVVMPPGYSAIGSVLVKDAIAETSPVSPALFAESLQDQEARSEIRNNGADSAYSVSAADDLLLVRATGNTAVQAVATVNAVLGSMSGRLAVMEAEAGVDPTLQSTVNVINAPETAISTEAGFEASGSAQIEGANASATPVDGETMRDALVQVLSSADIRRAIADEGGEADYEFGFQKGSPILEIEATGTDGDETVETVGLVISEAATQSERLADDLGGQKASGALTEDLVVPDSAVADRRGPLRSVAAIGVVGVGLALSLAVAIEAYAEWRRRVNDDLPADDPHSDPEQDPDVARAELSEDESIGSTKEPVGSALGPQGWRIVGERAGTRSSD